MTRTCNCKTLALVAGSVAMIAAAAAGEGTGLDSTNTYGGAAVDRSSELLKPTNTNGGQAVIESRAGGTFGADCATASLIACGADVNFDTLKTGGGWDIIDLNDPDENFCIGNAADPNRGTYWFRFVATATSALAHTCDSTSTDSSGQMYSGSCAGLTEIACSEDICGVAAFNSYLYAEGLTPGNTYYIQMGTWSNVAPAAGSGGVYNMKLLCPAPDCTSCTGGAVIDNDGACLDLDFVQNGNPADSPSVVAGRNNNYGCIEPDLAAGDPIRFQNLGAVTNVQICGTLNISNRSDQPATTFFRDFDWYPYTATGPSMTYEFFSNTGVGFFNFQLGNNNARGCDGDTVADPDQYTAAFAAHPLRPGTGAVLDCNSHWTNTIALSTGEGYNLVLRKNGDFSAPALCMNPVGREYTVFLNFGPPPTGACCETDDTCSDNTAQFDCFGIYRGNNSICASLPSGSECPTALPCPGGGLVENIGSGEVIGADDTINVGCNADPDPITGQVIPIAPDLIDCGNPSTLTWCGTTGNFNGNTRDLDWYRFTLPADAQVTAVLDAQVPMQMFMIETFDGNFIECDGETVVGFGLSTVKDGQITVTETLCAGDYYLAPATNGFTDFQVKPNVPTDLGWEYVLTVTCSPTLLDTGACCLKDATCIDTNPCNCADLNGLYYGDLTLCSDPDVLCCLSKCDGSQTVEGEPQCGTNYHDLYNGGCDADDHENWQTNDNYYTGEAVPSGTVATDPFLDTVLGQVWCGRVGEFVTNIRLNDGSVWANEQVRDTDWFRIQHAGGDLVATMCADQFTGQVFLFEETVPVGPTADICDTPLPSDTPVDAANRLTQNLANLLSDPCTIEVMDFGTQVAGQYYLVATSINTVFGNDFSCAQGKSYTFSFGDTSCAPCANVNGSPDNIVNLADLNLVLFNFGQSVAPGTNGDTNCDGQVNLADLNLVLFTFGQNVGCN